jgi:probable blue pigment (indigoidine) exporter
VVWTRRFLAALVFLALAGSAATHLIWFSELRHASLVTLSDRTLLTPVFGVAFGWLLLGNAMSGQQALGVGVVLAALPMILLPRFHRPGRRSRSARGRAARSSLIDVSSTSHRRRPVVS